MIELLAIACSLIQQQDKAELLVHEATGLHAEKLDNEAAWVVQAINDCDY